MAKRKSKHKVYITRQIPGIASKMLKKAGFEVQSFNKSSRKITRGKLLRKVKGCSGILSLLTERMDAQIMDAAGPQLKVIANFAVGYDNINIEDAQERRIKVGNTPCEEVNEAVAEMSMTMIMALSRNIIPADQYIRKGKYKTWDPLLMIGKALNGKTLGIVGLGRIGSGLAHRAADGFGLKIIYNDIRKNRDFEKRFKAKFAPFKKLIKESDFVSLHVPLLPSTRHLIGAKELKAMKSTAYLINTARGPVVDEIALNKALLRKEIAGAAIDVFECEPRIDCDPRDQYSLKYLDNIIMTPHIASATEEAREKMAELAAGNIIAAIKGKKMPTQVKPRK